METLCINKCGDCGINGGEGIIRQLATNLQGWPGNRTRIRRGQGLGRVGSWTSLGMLGHVRNFQDHQQSTLSDKKVTKLPDLPIFSLQQPGFRAAVVVRDSVIWWRTRTSFDTVSI